MMLADMIRPPFLEVLAQRAMTLAGVRSCVRYVHLPYMTKHYGLKAVALESCVLTSRREAIRAIMRELVKG